MVPHHAPIAFEVVRSWSEFWVRLPYLNPSRQAQRPFIRHVVCAKKRPQQSVTGFWPMISCCALALQEARKLLVTCQASHKIKFSSFPPWKLMGLDLNQSLKWQITFICYGWDFFRNLLPWTASLMCDSGYEKVDRNIMTNFFLPSKIFLFWFHY